MKRRKYNYTPGPNDLCQTPAYALEPLVPHLFVHCKEGNDRVSIWEPAAGELYLAGGIEKSTGYFPLTTDIDGKYCEQFDFLEASTTHCCKPFPSWAYDVIVTNPPYSLKKEFTTKCYEIGKPWALLMPADTIGNKWFIELANKYKPQPGIIWMSPRIDFKMPNKKWKGKGSHYNVAWFTWQLGFEGNIYRRMNHWTKEYKEENRERR